MHLAIIKPDHLGDLVLSAPAIRAARQRNPDTVLFVGPWNREAAGHLFPGLEIETVVFGHLSKFMQGEDRVPDLRRFDHVAILRNDHIINGGWADLRTRDYSVAPARNDIHQSLLDHAVMQPLIGDYDIDSAFYGARHDAVCAKLDRPPQRVGLSIGSGFHANLWPMNRWIELAKRLLQTGLKVSVIIGPSDRERGCYIATCIGLDLVRDMVTGTSDLPSLFEQVGDLDLIIATDGGAAHLCSTVTPVLSLFGPSPFRRYAPFGRVTRLITRGLACSPCCQYATNLVNGCLTMECMTHMTPDDVLSCLQQPVSRHIRPRGQVLSNGVQMWSGLSHIGRPEIGYHPGAGLDALAVAG